MMTKLLKYELKCLLRVLKPIYFCFIGLLLAVTAVGVFVSKVESLAFLSAFVNLMMYLVIIAFAASTMFVPVMRFYKSMVTNEAYQTFSLPVEMRSILCSKLIAAVSNNLVSFALIVIAAYVMSDKGNSSISIRNNRFYLYGETIPCHFVLLLILIFLILLCSYGMYNLLIFAAISLGQMFHKNNISGSLIAGVFLYMSIMVFFVPVILMMTQMQENAGETMIIVFCGVCIGVLLLIDMIFFSVCCYISKEKPNLV